MDSLVTKLKSFFILTVILFSVLPEMVFAGGGFKEKIQNKINSNKSQIQYNLEAVDYGPASEANTPAVQTVSQAPAQSGDEQSNKRLRRQGVGADTPVLSSYAIYKTDYKAEIEDDVATVQGNVLFEVFRKGWTQIPLVSSKVGLIDSSLNRGSSYITMQGGRYYLMMDKPGRYNLQIEFLVKAVREREGGPGNFNFEVIPAPISQFELTMPETDIDIFVDPAIKVETRKESNRTVAWAVMPNTNSITVRWTKAVLKEKITPVRLEPKVYADTATYVTIGEGLMRAQSSINYNILQSEISNMRLALPENVSVLDVKGNDLRDWKTSKEKGIQYIDVYLNFGVRGDYTLNVAYERKVSDTSGVVEIPWIKTINSEREKGFFGIAAATNVELALNKADNASVVDVKELPSSIWNMSANPILLAFKYLNHPFDIAVEVTKHEELPVLVAAIDSANYVSLQTDEGKVLTKAVYQMRNNVKQFLHLTLPNNAILWSVFVAGKPVKPARDNKNASILIPLEKSRFSGEDLNQFPVEIVYLDKVSGMGWLGGKRLSLPKSDIPVSSLSWALYLPLDYVYFNFGGNVKEIAAARGQALGGSVVSMKKALSYSVERSAGYDKDGYQVQQVSESEASSWKATGVLPIKVDIPEEGRLYRFSKLLVTENESPWVSLTFVKVIKKLRGIFWLLFWISAVILAVKFTRKLPKIIKKI